MKCSEVARLVSEGHDRRLSFFERLKVRMHLAMCIVCRRFARQIELIHRLARAVGRVGARSPVAAGGVFDASLSSKAKSRIKAALDTP